jgi:hypothetical protein
VLAAFPGWVRAAIKDQMPFLTAIQNYRPGLREITLHLGAIAQMQIT